MKSKSVFQRVRGLAGAAVEAFQADSPEEAAKILHPHIPPAIRLIPDLTDDTVGENETKLAVPGFRQLDCWSCGATAAFAVVKTFHPGAKFTRFYADVGTTASGTSESAIVRGLRKHGVGVSIRDDMDFNDIEAAIESGFPVIAGIGRDENEDGDHWVCIYGVGRKPKRIFVCNQPFILSLHGREEFTWKRWQRWWNPSGRGLVCWGK
jgi:hypothetical protein